MKKIKVSSVFELPHLYANRKGDFEKGRYRIEGNKFYQNSCIVAIRFGNDVFIHNGLRAGSWGSSMASSNIVWAFNEHNVNLYKCNELKDDIEFCIKNAVRYIVINEACNYVRLRKIVGDNAIQANYDIFPFIDNNGYVKLRKKYRNIIDFSFVSKQILG